MAEKLSRYWFPASEAGKISKAPLRRQAIATAITRLCTLPGTDTFLAPENMELCF
jgi:hypothetical protein